MRVDRYFDIISGRERGWRAGTLRLLLKLCTVPYLVVSELRNEGFRRGLFTVESVHVPVISVGNLTTGGTGKTPTVAWIIHQLQKLDQQPAIISRGYRSLDGEENDEKRLLDELCRGVPHLQNRRRIEAAREILNSAPVTALVLDDAFQHRQMHRDLDLVLIDALNPWGFGELLPRGLMRERLCHLNRAQLFLLTRCDLVPEEQLQSITKRIRSVSSAPVLRTRFEPQRFINAAGETLSLQQAAERPGLAFCGIGNPDGFRRTLTQLAAGISTDNLIPFPDHHHYAAEDLGRIQQRAESQGAELLLTTRKDLVKIRQNQIGGTPLWALDIALVFEEDPAELTDRLRNLFRGHA